MAEIGQRTLQSSVVGSDCLSTPSSSWLLSTAERRFTRNTNAGSVECSGQSRQEPALDASPTHHYSPTLKTQCVIRQSPSHREALSLLSPQSRHGQLERTHPRVPGPSNASCDLLRGPRPSAWRAGLFNRPTRTRDPSTLLIYPQRSVSGRGLLANWCSAAHSCPSGQQRGRRTIGEPDRILESPAGGRDRATDISAVEQTA